MPLFPLVYSLFFTELYSKCDEWSAIYQDTFILSLFGGSCLCSMPKHPVDETVHSYT